MKTGSKHINRRIGYIARYGDFVMRQKNPRSEKRNGDKLYYLSDHSDLAVIVEVIHNIINCCEAE